MRKPGRLPCLRRSGARLGTMRTAEAIAAEAVQVFIGIPRGCAPSAGDPAVDEEFRATCEARRPHSFVHTGSCVQDDTVDKALRKVRLVHASDSKDPRRSLRDRDERIGDGHIGEDAFAELFAHPATAGKKLRESSGDR